MLTLCLMTALAAPEFQLPVPDGPVFLAQAGEVNDATAMTPTLDDAPGLVNTLVQAVKDKNWQLVVAMALMLLVVLANTILIKFDLLGEEQRKLALPWVAAISGCLVITASTLLAGGSWLAALGAGFATGAAAVGLWELVFKHVGKLLAKKPPQP